MRRTLTLTLSLAFVCGGAAALHSPGGAAAAAADLDGKAIFSANCAACHQANGQGTDLFPALAGNKSVTAADPSAVIATVENGRNVMPSWKGRLSAAQIAAVLTYVRSAWGNAGAPVSEQDVEAVR
ncbi:MAG: c-type cytochrome [Vulcanimicrobiaceae bacterium]